MSDSKNLRTSRTSYACSTGAHSNEQEKEKTNIEMNAYKIEIYVKNKNQSFNQVTCASQTHELAFAR